jgi:hypothetical protein
MFKQISTFVRSKLPVLGVQNHSNHRYSTHRHRTQKDSRIPTARNSVVRAILWTAAISTLTLTVFDGFWGDLAFAASSANSKSVSHKLVKHKSVKHKLVSHKPAKSRSVSHKPISYKTIATQMPSSNHVRPLGQRSMATQLGGTIATNYRTYCQPDLSSIKPLCGGTGPDLETTPVSSQQPPQPSNQTSDNGFGFAQFQTEPFAEEEILFSAKSKPVVLYQYDRTVVLQQVL